MPTLIISTKPGLNRYQRVTPGGLLRTDAAKIKAEEILPGQSAPHDADRWRGDNDSTTSTRADLPG